MKFNEGYFDSQGDNKVYYYSWVPENPKGVIQIAHGMCEKALRYSYVAEKLAQNGYAVYANDHRGHGKTAAMEYGYMGKGDGFLLMVRDMKSLTDIIVKQHPNLPIFLLGHSMGSFLSVRYVQLYANLLSGVIFSGTGGYDQVTSSRAGARLA